MFVFTAFLSLLCAARVGLFQDVFTCRGQLGACYRTSEKLIATLNENERLKAEIEQIKAADLVRIYDKCFMVPKETPDPVSNYSGTLLPPDTINKDVVVGGKSYDLLSDISQYPGLQEALPLPKPIIVVGMPKAGTSSVFHFFRRAFGNASCSHWSVGPGEYVGECLVSEWEKQRGYASPTNAFERCGNFDVWAQMDVALSPKLCYFPQISHLRDIHDEKPNATFILNRRNYSSWYPSVKRWGNFATRVASCSVGPLSSSKQDLISWHRQQVERVRQFVFDHPSHALVEIDIEDNSETPTVMGRAFKLDSRYWSKSNTNP